MTSIDTATRSVKRFLGLACVVTVLTATLAWAGVSTHPFRTGLFGVTAGQKVRISVLHAGDGNGTVILVPAVRIWDAAGRLLFEASGGPLPSGMGAFVDFEPLPDGQLPTGGPGGRLQVRAEVELVPAVVPQDRAALRRLRRDGVLTLEVFETASGKTAFTMPFYPPDPIFPPDPVRKAR